MAKGRGPVHQLSEPWMLQGYQPLARTWRYPTIKVDFQMTEISCLGGVDSMALYSTSQFPGILQLGVGNSIWLAWKLFTVICMSLQLATTASQL